MGVVLAKRLSLSGQVFDVFSMARKTAREIVRKGQGDWDGEKREIVLLFWRDPSGRFHPPVPRREAQNRRYFAPPIIKAVQFCIAEQEQERKEGKKPTPLPGMQVPKIVRDQYKNAG